MKSNKDKEKKVSVCTICQKPATRVVDGEPSCEQHANLVYENQLEDYTKDHLADGEWRETPAGGRVATAGTRARTVAKT